MNQLLISLTGTSDSLSLRLHLKSSKSPKIAFSLPVSRDRGPETKKIRPQAVFRWHSGGHSYASLCQFLTEMSLSSPSWNFFLWQLWQKCIHLSYIQLHGGGKVWEIHSKLSNRIGTRIAAVQRHRKEKNGGEEQKKEGVKKQQKNISIDQMKI